jgi:Tetratricopeptide repeat
MSSMYLTEEKYADAEPLYARLIEVEQKAFGSKSQMLANTLINYATVLRKLGRGAEAAQMENRSKAILAEQASKKAAVNKPSPG